MTTTTRSTTRVRTRLGQIAVHRVGEGPPAVLWHSMFVDGRSWDRMVPALAAHRTLLVVDGPGYGDSDPLRRATTMEQCAEAAMEMLDQLGRTGPVDWVGNAWGGHLGYQLIGTHPDRIRSLVAVSAPADPLPRDFRRQLALLAHVLAVIGPVGPLRTKIADAQLTEATRRDDPAAMGVIDAALARTSNPSLARTLQSFIVRRTGLKPMLRGARLPILLVATDDRGELTPEEAQLTAALAERVEVVTVSGARTLVPVEQPAALVEHVLRFWEELDR